MFRPPSSKPNPNPNPDPNCDNCTGKIVHRPTPPLRLDRLNTTFSRSKSQKKGRKKQPLGLMQRNIYENLDHYRTLCTHELEQQRGSPSPNCQNITQKPQLTLKSQKLYEKVKRQRNLSPNVFQRLQTDEQNRSRSKIISIIKRIREVTPTRKIKRQDLQLFSTPKELKYFTKYLNTQETTN